MLEPFAIILNERNHINLNVLLSHLHLVTFEITLLVPISEYKKYGGIERLNRFLINKD